MLITASALAGCASAPAAEERVGLPSNTALPTPKLPGTVPPLGATREHTNIPTSPPHAADTTEDASSTTGRPTASGTPGRSCFTDASTDMDSAGSPPRYTDIVKACVRDSGRAAALEVSLASRVPQRMSDRDSNFAIGFDLGGSRYVFAAADADGWTTYIARTEGRERLRGAVKISGRTIRITVGWSELGDDRSFEWKAETNWTNSGLTSTSYAFDAAPDRGRATFQGGR